MVLERIYLKIGRQATTAKRIFRGFFIGRVPDGDSGLSD
jgi:hypothetical protein